MNKNERRKTRLRLVQQLMDAGFGDMAFALLTRDDDDPQGSDYARGYQDGIADGFRALTRTLATFGEAGQPEPERAA